MSFGRGLGQLALCLRWALCFDPFLSPALPPLTVFSPRLQPSNLSCSIPCYFPLQLVVSSSALLTMLPASLILFLSTSSGFFLFSTRLASSACLYFLVLVWLLSWSTRYLVGACHPVWEDGACRPSISLVSVVRVLGRCLSSWYEVVTFHAL